MLRLKSVPRHSTAPLGQSPELTTTITNNALPFILGMVTWAVFGNVLTSVGGVGQAAVVRGSSAAAKRISGGGRQEVQADYIPPARRRR